MNASLNDLNPRTPSYRHYTISQVVKQREQKLGWLSSTEPKSSTGSPFALKRAAHPKAQPCAGGPNSPGREPFCSHIAAHWRNTTLCRAESFQQATFSLSKRLAEKDLSGIQGRIWQECLQHEMFAASQPSETRGLPLISRCWLQVPSLHLS